MQYQCVSGDDHMDLAYIPARLWQERVPAKFRDQAPKIEEAPEGRRWICEGKPWVLGNYGTQRRGAMSGAIARAGLEEEPEPWVFRPSTPKYRLADMDLDRVDAHVIYGPPLPLTFENPDLRTVCLEAYNTWMSEFCSAAPGRLLGIAMLPMHDPTVAVNELKRVAKLGGLSGALFGVFDAVKPVFHEDWEPLWAVAAEAGIPISFHLGGGVRSARIGDPSRGQFAAFVSTVPMQLDEALSEIIFCGALDTHRKLKVVIAEAGIGWVPYLLYRMDHEYEKAFRHSLKLSGKPSELFRRQMFVTFQEDDIGLKLLDDLGEDNVIWASDYPHFDAIWPHSHKYIDEHMGALSAATRKKVTCDNAVRLYNLA